MVQNFKEFSGQSCSARSEDGPFRVHRYTYTSFNIQHTHTHTRILAKIIINIYIYDVEKNSLVMLCVLYDICFKSFSPSCQRTNVFDFYFSTVHSSIDMITKRKIIITRQRSRWEI